MTRAGSAESKTRNFQAIYKAINEAINQALNQVIEKGEA